MFLDEEVGVFRISAVALGLVGVLIVLAPRLTALSGPTVETMQAVGAMLALTGAICAALAQIYVRKLVQTEETSAIVFFFLDHRCRAVAADHPVWLGGALGPENRPSGAGRILGGLGQIFLTSSYRFADASVVAPFDYASILFALGIGYFIFGRGADAGRCSRGRRWSFWPGSSSSGASGNLASGATRPARPDAGIGV